MHDSVLIQKLSKDLSASAKTMTQRSAKFLVHSYYSLQKRRIRDANQIQSLEESHAPVDVLKHFYDQNEMLEKQIASVLDKYSMAHEIGIWARGQVGIGPIITAGLIAHVDIQKCVTPGQLWAYAGLAPGVNWEKGKSCPWNRDLKTLCWKMGESFVKVSGNEKAYYGKVYLNRKVYEQEQNSKGQYAGVAEQYLKRFKYDKSTAAYKSYIEGRLPDAHIHSRAKRYSVKFFLSHFHTKWREISGLPASIPYAIAHMNHAHYVEPPEPIR